MLSKKIAIIGAGASGLPAIRHALAYGLEPTAFEVSNGIGGLWRYKPNETDESSVMKTTTINTSKEMTAYSDFPPPAHYPNFMHNSKLLDYLESYAKHFNLNNHIKFNHQVENIARAKSYKETGKWVVTYRDSNNKTLKKEFDGVLVATGHHKDPYIPPKWPGQENFKGKITHSKHFKDSKGYEDKVVAIVGIGNSAADIGVELSRTCKQVYMITRSSSWIYSRLVKSGQPYDYNYFTKFHNFMSSMFPKSFAKYAENRFQQRFDQDLYGMRPAFSPMTGRITANCELPFRLANGTIKIKRHLKSFTENGLVFEDDSRINNVDEVILATGYQFSFPMIENDTLIPVRKNQVSLYKNMYPLETSDHNTLACSGLVQPMGSLLPLFEMQSRLFCSNIAGETKLPSKEGMTKDIHKGKSGGEKQWNDLHVNYYDYLDGIAKMIGCYPDIREFMLYDPKLAYTLFFKGNTGYAYRLTGPNAWPQARDTIMTINDRIAQGMVQEDYSTDKIEELQPVLA